MFSGDVTSGDTGVFSRSGKPFKTSKNGCTGDARVEGRNYTISIINTFEFKTIKCPEMSTLHMESTT